MSTGTIYLFCGKMASGKSTQRKWMTDVIAQAGAYYEFYYLNNSDTICKDQLKSRAVKEPGRHATDTTEMFDAITKFFEPPASDEGFEILHHERT